MKSEINWYKWDYEILREVYKEHIERIENDHNMHIHVNILVIYKSKEKNRETEYKIMSSKVGLFWDSKNTYAIPYNIPGVHFYLYDISESSILAFSPMYSALPQEFK